LNAGLLAFEGEKAPVMLHGQLTNDIKKLLPSTGNLNLLLSLKGKVRAVLQVIRTETGCLSLVDEADVALLQEHFSKMAPLSRVSLLDLSSQFYFVHIFAQQLPWSLDQKANQYLVSDYEGVKVHCYQHQRYGSPGFDCWVSGGSKQAFLDLLQAQQIQFMEAQELESVRIKAGIPINHVDFSDDNLPQECRLDAALNFEKGCYLGQEIIARLHYKGHVNKLLKQLKITGGVIPSAGDKLLHEGKEVGWITSVTQNDEGSFALGYVPYKMSNEGLSFELKQGGAATLL